MTCPVRESSVISSSARSRLGAAGALFGCGSVVYHYSTHRPASAIGRACWPTATTLIFVAPSRTLQAVCQTIGETRFPALTLALSRMHDLLPDSARRGSGTFRRCPSIESRRQGRPASREYRPGFLRVRIQAKGRPVHAGGPLC